MTIGYAGYISLPLIDSKFDKSLIKGVDFKRFPLGASIVNGFLERGYKVIVYTYAHDIDHSIVIKDENLIICIARRKSKAGRRLFYSEKQELLEFMLKYPADIINAQWSYEFAWAALDSKIPTVITVRDHALTILKFHKDLFRFSRWIINFIVMNRAKWIIANSEYLKSLINRKKLYIEVISNFYDPALEDMFNQNTGRDNVIVTISHGFDERKNISNGLRAFSLIRKRHPNMEYHLVGMEMGENEKAHKYAIKNGLSKGVKFLGIKSYSSVVEKIRNSKVLLHPSREESFGNTILEGILLGTPVVGGRSSGNVPYLLNFGEYGCVCDVNDPKSVAASVLSLLDDENLWNSIRFRAYEYVKAKFNRDITIDALLKYYRRIIDFTN